MLDLPACVLYVCFLVSVCCEPEKNRAGGGDTHLKLKAECVLNLGRT